MRLLIFVAILSVLLLGACALVKQPLVRPIVSPPAEVDAAALERHVRKLAVDLHPRSFDHRVHNDAAADHVRAAFEASGARVELQDIESSAGVYRNVIARFGPADAAANAPVVVIGAHYDSCGDTPGADDNASGVAGMLELARLLGAQPPPHAVELVAWGLEEPPFFRTASMGSVWHARALAQQARTVRLAMSLEMIGYFTDAPDSQRYPMSALELFYPDKGNFIAIVGRFGDFSEVRRVKALFTGATDLPIVSINAPKSVPGVDFSDHASYWSHGMPAVMITDTAFLRNPNYHEAGDTPETLDYARMAKVVQATYAVAMRF